MAATACSTTLRMAIGTFIGAYGNVRVGLERNGREHAPPRDSEIATRPVRPRAVSVGAAGHCRRHDGGLHAAYVEQRCAAAHRRTPGPHAGRTGPARAYGVDRAFDLSVAHHRIA